MVLPIGPYSFRLESLGPFVSIVLAWVWLGGVGRGVGGGGVGGGGPGVLGRTGLVLAWGYFNIHNTLMILT